MKARILDAQVKVYGSIEANAVSIAYLPAGSEVEFAAPKRRNGKLWVPIIMSTGQAAFIPGDTRIFVVRLANLLQDNVELRVEPSAAAMIKQKLAKGAKIYILEVVKKEDGDWVRVRDMNNVEGFVAGDTRIRVIQEKTKALGRKNMLSGAMWLIAGLIVTFSSTTTPSGTYALLGYGAILFGVVMLISGIVQLITAKA